MCSINGFTWKDEVLIKKMNDAVKHRGPDATHTFISDAVSLGHNRLSIIDLSKAADQPMRSSDDKYTIVYNGELYNFKELRKELEVFGYVFKTQSDTEVILTAYQKWGTACVTKFNGIFAFAIWDMNMGQLFLARDHNGIKPLYYHHKKDGRFVFSSEIKALLEHDIPRTISLSSLERYLRVLYVPGPSSLFKEIMKLSPGYTAIVKNGVLTLNKYFRPKNEADKTMSQSTAEYMVQQKMSEVIERQLISDRPIGIFLSGGIDSTIILDHVSKARRSINTFSVGFDLTETEQHDKFNQDFNLARRTAQVYGTTHHEILLNVSDVTSTLEKAVWNLDEPVANPTIVAQYVLSQFSKKYVDVVLGGDGGDELFGGYDRYRFSIIASMYRRLPDAVRALCNRFYKLKKLDLEEGIDQYAQFFFQKDKVVKEVAPLLVSEEPREFFKKQYFSDHTVSPFVAQFMNIDRQTWLIDESLLRSDKMSMAAGLELRVPFLDKEMVEFALRVPARFKVSMRKTKILLRKAYATKLPKFIFNQPKRGWFSPGAKWLRNTEIHVFAQNILRKDYHAPTSSLFDWIAVEKMLADHKDNLRYNSTMLWTLIIFQIWAKKYNVHL